MNENEAVLRELTFVRQDMQSLSAQVQSLTKTLGGDTLPRLATVEQKALACESSTKTNGETISRLADVVSGHKMALAILGAGIVLLGGGLLAHLHFS